MDGAAKLSGLASSGDEGKTPKKERSKVKTSKTAEKKEPKVKGSIESTTQVDFTKIPVGGKKLNEVAYTNSRVSSAKQSQRVSSGSGQGKYVSRPRSAEITESVRQARKKLMEQSSKLSLDQSKRNSNGTESAALGNDQGTAQKGINRYANLKTVVVNKPTILHKPQVADYLRSLENTRLLRSDIGLRPTKILD